MNVVGIIQLCQVDKCWFADACDCHVHFRSIWGFYQLYLFYLILMVLYSKFWQKKMFFSAVQSKNDNDMLTKKYKLKQIVC